MSDISTRDTTSYYIDVGSNIGNESLKISEKYYKDYELVQKILNNNEKAWQIFIEKTQDFLYFTLKKIITKTNFKYNVKQKAYELIEDLFLDFYQHLLKNDLHLLKMYKGKSKLSSYLYVCLNNFVYDFFKSRKWKSYLNEICVSELNSYASENNEEMSISEIVDKYSPDKINTTFNPEKELYKKEISKIINELVSSLSEREQFCFNLLFVDELKPSEASLILGISPFEVSQIKYRIKEKLKKLGRHRLSEFLDEL